MSEHCPSPTRRETSIQIIRQVVNKPKVASFEGSIQRLAKVMNLITNKVMVKNMKTKVVKTFNYPSILTKLATKWK